MKISVALCTFNGEKFIKEQINSILNQTLQVNEIIICDDLSTDNTFKIISNYQQNNPDLFKIFQNNETLKSVKNFEKAISLCTGDITFLSDQDDYWHPKKVQITTNKFRENPSIAAFCSNGFLMNDDSEIMSDFFSKWDVYEKYLNTKTDFDAFNFLTQKGNFSTGATMAIKTEFAKSILPIPQIADFHHDEWLTLLATVDGKMGFIPQKLINYRIHSSQQVGGVAFRNDSDYFNEILSYFRFNNKTDDFKSIKSRIKAQVKWHNEFLINFKSNPQQFAVLDNKFQKEYKKNTELLKRKYPLKSFLINTFDQILNKRQLNK